MHRKNPPHLTHQIIFVTYTKTYYRLKRGLKSLFPDLDTAKIMDKVYTKLNSKISELFNKRKKAKITFTKAKNSSTVRLNLICNFMQIMMTADILNMVKTARAELYYFTLEEYLYFTKLTLSDYIHDGLDDFIDELMVRISKLQSRLTNKQRKLIYNERKQKMKEMNKQLEGELMQVKASAGINQVNAERLELERRKNPDDHDWRFIDGEWVEVVISGGKMKIIKNE